LALLGWPWLAVLPLPRRRGRCGGRAMAPRRIALVGARDVRDPLLGGCVGIGAGGIGRLERASQTSPCWRKGRQGPVVSRFHGIRCCAQDTPLGERMKPTKKRRPRRHDARHVMSFRRPGGSGASPSLRDEGKE